MSEHFSDRICLTEDQSLGEARKEVNNYSPGSDAERRLQATAQNLIALIDVLIDYPRIDGLNQIHPMAREAVRDASEDFLNQPVQHFPNE